MTEEPQRGPTRAELREEIGVDFITAMLAWARLNADWSVRMAAMRAERQSLDEEVTHLTQTVVRNLIAVGGLLPAEAEVECERLIEVAFREKVPA